jgi:peptide deformylase
MLELITVESPKAGILRRRARAVGRITPQIQPLVDGMVTIMRQANGVGLAAPQVGVNKRVLVARVEERLHVLIDPVIVRSEGEEVGTEGCLSIPGIVAEVPRAARVVVKGKNRKGKGITLRAEGLLARVLQHEVDHLDGILFLDRVRDKSTIRDVAASAEVDAAVPTA